MFLIVSVDLVSYLSQGRATISVQVVIVVVSARGTSSGVSLRRVKIHLLVHKVEVVGGSKPCRRSGEIANFVYDNRRSKWVGQPKSDIGVVV